MPTLYLIEQNTTLRKTSDSLRLCKKPSSLKKSAYVSQEEVLLELPCSDIDQVMIFGNVQVTTQALHELLEHGIEVSLFSFSGKLLGQVTPPKTKNINLRLDQFNKYNKKQFHLKIAKSIVTQKIYSIQKILREFHKNHPDAFDLQDISSLPEIIERVKNAITLDSLLGFEGSASAIYFKLFGKMIKPPWKFDGRNRRPPKDPVNAVLSFGYVVVGSELQSLLDGIGFDPYLGFYHSIHYGRPSLALDLLEEFRHSFVDRLTLNLFNRHTFTESDFYNPPGGGVYMNTEGKKKFFVQYEKMLGEYVGASSVNIQKTGIRSVFQNQIHLLAKAIQQDIPYKPWSG